jgi:hypothetical protein
MQIPWTRQQDPEQAERDRAEREMGIRGAGRGTYAMLALVTLLPAAGLALHLWSAWDTPVFRSEAALWLTVFLLAELLAGLLLVARWFQRLTTNSDIEELRKMAYSYRLGSTLALRPFLNADGEQLSETSDLAAYRKDIIEPNFYKSATNPPFCLALLLVVSLGLFAFYAPRLSVLGLPIIPLLGPQLGSWNWQPGAAVADELMTYGSQALVCVAFAFAGSLVWAVIYLTRRMSLRDVTAYTYQEVTMRLIVSAIVALVAYHVFGSGVLGGSISGELLMLVGFGAGVMPETVLRWLFNKASRLFGSIEQNDRIDLEHIQGINAFTRARLVEVGIYDAQGLVTTNPLRLSLHTPYSLPQIIDWYGQAFLLLYFQPAGLDLLRSQGIRTVWEFVAASQQVPGTLKLREGEPAAEAAATVIAALKANPSYERTTEIEQRMRLSPSAPDNAALRLAVAAE